MDPLGKNSSVFRMPKVARGTRGSSTRTIIRNIMQLNAAAVARIIASNPSMVRGLKIVPTPAISDPIMVMTSPVSTPLMAPAPFSPNTSSVLVIGVTRYPSWIPRALSSMYNIPPPIMADTNMASAIDPGSRYFIYSMYGYNSTTSSAVCCSTSWSGCGVVLFLARGCHYRCQGSQQRVGCPRKDRQSSQPCTDRKCSGPGTATREHDELPERVILRQLDPLV